MIVLKQKIKNWTIGWGISSKCDLNCPFCYSKKNREFNNNVTLEDFKSFIINNAKNIRSINFGTGEPFLSPIFNDILKFLEITKNNLTIAVTTNGAIIERLNVPEHLSLYSKIIDELDVSIDFCSPQLHNSFRGRFDAWERAISAIELGKKLNCKTCIVMVGMPQTITNDNISGMLSLANHFDVALRMNIYMPTNGNLSYILDQKQFFEIIMTLKNSSKQFETSDPLISALLEFNSGCNYTKTNSIRLLPNSTISPSTYLLEEPWAEKINIGKFKLSQLSKVQAIYNWDNAPMPEECKKCGYKESCRGGSKERRILWYKTLLERDPYCPYRYNSTHPVNISPDKTDGKENWMGPSVHLNYLPTFICVPKNNNKNLFDFFVKSIIINKNNEILILKKSEPNIWELPGGRIKSLESNENALIRELHEELNISFDNIRIIDKVKWASYLNNKCILGTTFIISTSSSFVPKLSEGNCDYRWINYDFLDDYLNTSINQAFLDLYKYCIKKSYYVWI
jgi:8-oxo-dGTP diphosphatase